MDEKRKQEIREFAGGWAVMNMAPRVSDITHELLDALDKADVRAESLKIEYERVNKRMLAIAGRVEELEEEHEEVEQSLDKFDFYDEYDGLIEKAQKAVEFGSKYYGAWKIESDRLDDAEAENARLRAALRMAYTEATEMLPQRHPLSTKTIHKMQTALGTRP